MRSSGILMHISSLPNPYGIGTLGSSAYEFVNFLHKAGQKYWQILPLGHTSYGDSPYQTFSAFAGNPYFIDLDFLKNDGLLKEEEYQNLRNTSSEYVDFGFQYYYRYPILRMAYQRFKKAIPTDFKSFKKQNADWLNDYALFMALKDHFNGCSWLDWDNDYKTRNEKALKEFKTSHREEIGFWCFIQYEFYKQWFNLKKYANEQGIKIIGDMPIYVAMDSADVWSNVKYYQISQDYVPERVAGCPPDMFSPTGQLWGNPLYNYEAMKADGYKWWIKRVKKSFELCDVVRIDHFRGFEAYWSIPYGDKTAERGEWVKGPNVDLFKAINKKLGKLDLIAENLGFLTEEVHEMLRKLAYPGMSILEFGFDTYSANEYTPHNLVKNTIVYPGTHDNSTIKGWYQNLNYDNKRYILNYLNLEKDDNIVESIIKSGLRSVADTVIVQMQDYLELDDRARMNVPNTLGTNWKWRATSEQLIDDLAYRINHWTKLYER